VQSSVVKTPRSCHINPVLRSLHWLKITERIEYKLLSLTYKVLTTTQPPYLHHLISVQPPRSTRSSSLVTLARPPTSFSLMIAPSGTPHLVSGINFLVLSVNLISAPLSLCCLFMLLPHLLSSLCQLTTLTIHNSLSLSRPPQDLPLSQIFPTIDSLPASGLHDSTYFTTGAFLLSISVFCFTFFIILFCFIPCGRLSWLLVSFWAHVNIVNRVVSL